MARSRRRNGGSCSARGHEPSVAVEPEPAQPACVGGLRGHRKMDDARGTGVAAITELDPSGIMEIGTGSRRSKVLLSAVGLGLFTELADSPLMLREIRRPSAPAATGRRLPRRPPLARAYGRGVPLVRGGRLSPLRGDSPGGTLERGRRLQVGLGASGPGRATSGGRFPARSFSWANLDRRPLCCHSPRRSKLVGTFPATRRRPNANRRLLRPRGPTRAPEKAFPTASATKR